MRSLKEVLLEKLENTNVARTAAEEYTNANYDVKGILTYENVNGTCIVNCDGNVKVKNKKIEKLTNGFWWGNVKGDFICSNCINLKSLEGVPENVGGNFDCRGCHRPLYAVYGGELCPFIGSGFVPLNPR